MYFLLNEAKKQRLTIGHQSCVPHQEKLTQSLRPFHLVTRAKSINYFQFYNPNKFLFFADLIY